MNGENKEYEVGDSIKITGGTYNKTPPVKGTVQKITPKWVYQFSQPLVLELLPSMPIDYSSDIAKEYDDAWARIGLQSGQAVPFWLQILYVVDNDLLIYIYIYVCIPVFFAIWGRLV